MTKQLKEKEELIYGYPKAVHELAERYIERDILCCDTMLINDLQSIGGEYNVDSEFSLDNVENLYKDNDTLIEEYCNEEDLEDICEDIGIEYTGSAHVFTEEEKEKIVQAKGVDAEPQEIFEWWRTTEWLAEKLKAQNEPVLCNSYGYWWGRTCTGQNIILDGTIQRIAENYV